MAHAEAHLEFSPIPYQKQKKPKNRRQYLQKLLSVVIYFPSRSLRTEIAPVNSPRLPQNVVIMTFLGPQSEFIIYKTNRIMSQFRRFSRELDGLGDLKYSNGGGSEGLNFRRPTEVRRKRIHNRNNFYSWRIPLLAF